MTEMREDIKTIVFFDCEATDLTGSRLTEISFIAVHIDEFTQYTRLLKQRILKSDERNRSTLLHFYPRVLNKLTLAVNPWQQIPLLVEDLTGLNNYNLEYQASFAKGPHLTITRFLESLLAPVCLVAHNGTRFDVPLLVKEMEKASCSLSPDLLCADSLVFFKEFYRTLPQHLIQDVENVEEEYNSTEEGDEEVEELNLLKTPTKPDILYNSSPFLNTPEKSPNPKRGLVSPFNTPTKTPLVPRDTPTRLGLSDTPTKDNLLPSTLPQTPPRSERKRRPCGSLEERGNKISRAGIDTHTADLYYPPLRAPPAKYSLEALHRHIFGMKPIESHGSEIDSLVLLRTLAVFGDSFTTWMNERSSKISKT